MCLPVQLTTAVDAGMAATGLQPLLHGAGLDVFTRHIMPLLTVQALGRLATTSKCLRDVVQSAPESTWQACARRTLHRYSSPAQPPPRDSVSSRLHACRTHPVFAAPSARHCLQQQVVLRAKLAAGDVTVHTGSLPCSPALAPDLSMCAVSVADPPRLVLLELPGPRQLASWDLPQPLSNDSSTWQWSRCGVVAVPWGDSWLTPSGALTGEPGRAGVTWVDTSSGVAADADLGVQSNGEPALGPFTPCGLLPVRHSKDGVLVWSLFDESGHAQHTVPCPRASQQPGVLFAEQRLEWVQPAAGDCMQAVRTGGREDAAQLRPAPARGSVLHLALAALRPVHSFDAAPRHASDLEALVA